MSKLKNKRHERFCVEYVNNGFNGAKAARATGSTVVSSADTAHRLLTYPDLLERVNQLNDNYYEELAMNGSELKNELEKLAKFNPKGAYDENGVLLHVIEMDDETAVSVREIETVHGAATKVKFSNDKKAALDLLAKMQNMYEQHQEANSGEIHIYMDEKDAKA